MLTDGAARIVTLFKSLDWSGLLDVLTTEGPSEVIERLRSIEDADPYCIRWPRNKPHDDATLVFVG